MPTLGPLLARCLGRCSTAAAPLAFGCALSLIGCASTLSSAQVECQLGVLRALPEDPAQATVADAVDAIHRLRACDALPTDPPPASSSTTGPGPPRDAGR
jgi:hypothetical protein